MNINISTAHAVNRTDFIARPITIVESESESLCANDKRVERRLLAKGVYERVTLIECSLCTTLF